MANVEPESVREDDDEIPACSVEGCHRTGVQSCEMCGEVVCGPHSRTNVMAEMILCFSCDIGISEGLSAAMKGW